MSKLHTEEVTSGIPKLRRSNSRSKYSDLLLMIKFNLSSYSSSPSSFFFSYSDWMIMRFVSYCSSFSLSISTCKSAILSSVITIAMASSKFILHFFNAKAITSSDALHPPKKLLSSLIYDCMTAGSISWPPVVIVPP